MNNDSAANLVQSRIAIVGLGLMGGSLALALAGRCREIIGVDADSAPLTVALQRGIIHRTADFNAALEAADLIILAAPVRTIIKQLSALSRQPSAVSDQQSAISNQQSKIILDLGSTKSAIVSVMQHLPLSFDPLGGHPMCGKEISGLGNADSDLYRGKTFVLCPLDRTSPRALALAHELVSVIGAQPLVLDAEVHDACAAAISHLPYAVAAALMQTTIANSNEYTWRMAASGFRDTTRLAGSDLTMMIDILLTNRAAVLRSLAQFRTELDSITTAIESNDPTALRAALESAQHKRGELFR